MNKPTLSKVVHTLLVAETPLVKSELAERADVSVRAIRNHTERLAAFDFVRETGEGWRFVLPFHTDEERGETTLPWNAGPTIPAPSTIGTPTTKTLLKVADSRR
ncbi:MAG TPA: hypothetical protein VFJ06_05940 [Halococcus sp.]|nr:hypothetical protein [Halococcus sp.]